MRQAKLVVPFAIVLGLGSCQAMQEMGRALDQVGASLVRNLTTTPAAPAARLEVTQPLPAELETRRQAGELRAAVAVNDPGFGPSAAELLRGTAMPMQGAAIVLPATAGDAEAWFASLPERAAAAELPESELLVGAHVVPGAAGAAPQVEVRAFDRATETWVFAARTPAVAARSATAARPAELGRLAEALAPPAPRQ